MGCYFVVFITAFLNTNILLIWLNKIGLENDRSHCGLHNRWKISAFCACYDYLLFISLFGLVDFHHFDDILFGRLKIRRRRPFWGFGVENVEQVGSRDLYFCFILGNKLYFGWKYFYNSIIDYFLVFRQIQ